MNNVNMPPSPKSPYAHQSFLDAWWGKVLCGLACFAGSFWFHLVFTDLETGVMQSVRVHWIIALVYNTLGHIPTIAILVLAGFGCLIFGLWQMIREVLHR